jgi:hypothetical protein
MATKKSAAKKSAAKKKVRDDSDAPKITLKEIKEATKMLLTDYAGPFGSDEHPEYGESYLLNVVVDDEPRKLFLNEKSVAGKTFFRAVDDGKMYAVDMGGTMELIFRPRDTGNPPPADVMVGLRFGKVTAKGSKSSDEGDEADLPF